MQTVASAESTRKANLQMRASRAGLHVSTYSPGDGATRYKFSLEKQDYFAGDGVFVALGYREAETWLLGYITDRRHGERGA